MSTFMLMMPRDFPANLHPKGLLSQRQADQFDVLSSALPKGLTLVLKGQLPLQCPDGQWSYDSEKKVFEFYDGSRLCYAGMYKEHMCFTNEDECKLYKVKSVMASLSRFFGGTLRMEATDHDNRQWVHWARSGTVQTEPAIVRFQEPAWPLDEDLPLHPVVLEVS